MKQKQLLPDKIAVFLVTGFGINNIAPYICNTNSENAPDYTSKFLLSSVG